MTKRIVLIIVVAISLGLGWFVYRYYRLPNRNTGGTWKTYKNTAFKYSISYPSSWHIDTLDEPETSVAPYLTSPCATDKRTNCLEVLIEIADCGKDIICHQISPQFPPPYDSKSGLGAIEVLLRGTVSDVQPMTLGGEKAVRFIHSGHPLLRRADDTPIYLAYIIVANHNNLTYEITYREWGKKVETNQDWVNKDVFDKMINTFRFLD